MWFIDVEVEQEMSAPPPEKNPGSAPGTCEKVKLLCLEFMLESAGRTASADSEEYVLR